MGKLKILYAEDDETLAFLTKDNLEQHGYEVVHCSDGNICLEQFQKEDIAICILDIMLPKMDGFEIATEIRKRNADVPIIFLSAKTLKEDRIRGLRLGADDYLAKPFYVEELAARLQALIRRAAGDKQNLLQVGSLSLDRIARRASCHGQEIDLTTREYSLLEYLMRSAGQVFTRGQILEHVWGYDFDPTTNVVDVCIKRIRHKIASIEGNETMASPIESVRGVGYRFRQSD